MNERLSLIARLGAAMATVTDPALQAVLSDALTAIVDDHGLVAAQERRKAKDRNRKRSVDSGDSKDSVESAEIVESSSPSSPPSLLSPTPPNNSSPPSPPPSGATVPAIVPRAAAVRPDVESVVAHYVRRHPKRRPGGKDRKLIERHLATYSASELCEAIDGNADDEWAQRTGKHELTWVLRDNGQIDTYRAKADVPAPVLKDGWFADVGT